MDWFLYDRDQVCNFIKKETLAQVFFCEFCKISKNTFSYRTPPVFASDFSILARNMYLKLEVFEYCFVFIECIV